MIIPLLILAYWLVKGLDFVIGILYGVPRLEKDKFSSAILNYPRVSIIFAAKDEAKRVGSALRTFLAQDYPDFEVIAVNDRSTDETLAILNSVKNPRLKVLDIQDLPSGWLGKTHALYEGYKISKGEWLLFTDADVHMDPLTLKTAVAAAEAQRLEHLTLFPKLVIHQYIEAVFTNYFAILFNFRYRPWSARFKRSLSYVGIGAFNMVRRETYEGVGTHKRLALDIADDMMLGKIIKRCGAGQMAMFGDEFISVRWVEGFAGVLHSLHKNAFRGLNYNYPFLALSTLMILGVDILPFAGLFFLKGAAFYFSAASVFCIFLVYLAGQKHSPRSLLTFFAHPFAALLFIFTLWRSAVSVLKEGGVRWRDTFYPVEDLRRSML